VTDVEQPEEPLDTEELLLRAREQVETARSVPMSASVMVNRDELLGLIEDAISGLPEEVRQARWLLKEREEFLAKARREAEDIIDAGRQQAERMVERTEVVREARRRAQQVIDDADAQARALKHEAEDYIDQMLKSVYGPRFELVDAEDYHRPAGISGSKVAGRDAKHFAVLSPTEVPADTKWGTSVNPETGRIGVVRLHEYVVIPVQKGFYVLVYPATRDGFKLYKPQFNAFVHGFTILAEGPSNSATGAARH